MTARNESPKRPASAPAPTPLSSLLVPLDLSVGSERVLQRAALLPLAPRAQLTLLHAVPKVLPRDASRRARQDAARALAALATNVRTARPKARIQHVVRVGAAAAEIAQQARTLAVELIVMGRGGGRGVRDMFLGSTAERVVRQAQLPVLVVRRPARTAYRRPLLAIDLEQSLENLVGWMLRALPHPHPQVTLVHASDAPFQGLVYPSLTSDEAREYRDHYRHKALHEIAQQLPQALQALGRNESQHWKTFVQHGSPRTIIPALVKKTGADLLVLGTRGHAGLQYAFLGTIAGDVLREVPCDVLVVPVSAKSTTAPA